MQVQLTRGNFWLCHFARQVSSKSLAHFRQCRVYQNVYVQFDSLIGTQKERKEKRPVNVCRFNVEKVFYFIQHKNDNFCPFLIFFLLCQGPFSVMENCKVACCLRSRKLLLDLFKCLIFYYFCV